MQQPQHPLLAKVMPFIALGVFIVLFVIGLIVSFYLLIWGALIGGVIFVIAWLKAKFFPSKNKKADAEGGRIIEHDDINK